MQSKIAIHLRFVSVVFIQTFQIHSHWHEVGSLLDIFEFYNIVELESIFIPSNDSFLLINFIYLFLIIKI